MFGRVWLLDLLLLTGSSSGHLLLRVTSHTLTRRLVTLHSTTLYSAKHRHVVVAVVILQTFANLYYFFPLNFLHHFTPPPQATGIRQTHWRTPLNFTLFFFFLVGFQNGENPLLSGAGNTQHLFSACFTFFYLFFFKRAKQSTLLCLHLLLFGHEHTRTHACPWRGLSHQCVQLNKNAIPHAHGGGLL